MTEAAGELRLIRMLDIPVAVHARAVEHQAELQREFQLILIARQDRDVDVPQRLLELVEVVNSQFQGLSGPQTAELDAAIARGDDRLDLDYHLPAAVAGASIALNSILDECDEYCRRGDALLTLATPPEALAYRRWFLGEFVAQSRGEAPLPWTAADVDALLASPTLRGC